MTLAIGCCCDAGCLIVDDTYDADTSADYTIVSGAFTLGGGVATSSSNGGILILNEEAPTTPEGGLRIRLNGGAGEKLRIIAAYQDANNYAYCEVIVGTSMRMWQVVAGVHTALNPATSITFNANTYYDMRVCFFGTQISANQEVSGASAYGTYTPGGGKIGFGLGSAGTITVDRLRLYAANTVLTGCIDCQEPCTTICENNTTPRFFQLEFTAGTGFAACLIGFTYILTRNVSACARDLVSVPFSGGAACLPFACGFTGDTCEMTFRFGGIGAGNVSFGMRATSGATSTYGFNTIVGTPAVLGGQAEPRNCATTTYSISGTIFKDTIFGVVSESLTVLLTPIL